MNGLHNIIMHQSAVVGEILL